MRRHKPLVIERPIYIGQTVWAYVNKNRLELYTDTGCIGSLGRADLVRILRLVDKPQPKAKVAHPSKRSEVAHGAR
jgi:hypothetical protein